MGEDIRISVRLTDDGISGTTFNRPGFQEMERMIEAGDIGTVIVKDLSRFGRDHVFGGYYLQIKYPSPGVNFISLVTIVMMAIMSQKLLVQKCRFSCGMRYQKQ